MFPRSLAFEALATCGIVCCKYKSGSVLRCEHTHDDAVSHSQFTRQQPLVQSAGCAVKCFTLASINTWLSTNRIVLLRDPSVTTRSCSHGTQYVNQPLNHRPTHGPSSAPCLVDMRCQLHNSFSYLLSYKPLLDIDVVVDHTT